MTDQKREYWSNLIAEQEASGQTIRAFCQEQGVGDHSFYYWRKRLQKSEQVQFALLKTVASAAPLELILAMASNSGSSTVWTRRRFAWCWTS
jgi:transposase-like protein